MGRIGNDKLFWYWLPYHKFFKYLGLNLTDLTWVEKTATAHYNEGNMPMGEDGITPKEFFPSCIYVNLRSLWWGGALNAVALSNPGVGSLIRRGMWQEMKVPFFISVMAIGNTLPEKIKEMELIKKHLRRMLDEVPHLRSLLGIQINLLCPNLKDHEMEKMLKELVIEASLYLDIFGELDVSLVPKTNLLLPVEEAIEIGNHPYCAGLSLSNTIGWNDLSKVGIDRAKIFGGETSPLNKRGFKQPGGYSGAQLLPLVWAYIKQMRRKGFTKHINAGGGILHPSAIDMLKEAGANSVSLGSIAFLRPWQTGPTIRRARQLMS